MDDYTREMMDLKTLVTRSLEKKGVLAKIRVPPPSLLHAKFGLRGRVIESLSGSSPGLKCFCLGDDCVGFCILAA